MITLFTVVTERKLSYVPILCEEHLSSMCFKDWDMFESSSRLNVNKYMPDVVAFYPISVFPACVIVVLHVRTYYIYILIV